jgi:heat shock protein HspQ
MSAMSGASTYAVGQVAKSVFGSQGGIIDVDMQWAKDAYAEALDRGKEFVSRVEKDNSKDVYESLDKLGKLREQGVITDEEFEAQKQKLLERV